MRCFPLCINLKDQTVLLVGSGTALQRKAEQLLPFGPCIRSIPPGTALTAADLTPPPAFVLVTDAPEEDKLRISRLCKEAGIPVNVADEPELCTFYFPALITRGHLTVAVSTDGTSPAAASLLRQRMEAQIPLRMEEILDWATVLRTQLKVEIPHPKMRAALLKQAVAEAMDKNRPLTDEEVAALGGGL